MKGLMGQVMRFGAVGVAATIVDFAILILLVEVVGFKPVIAAGSSYVIATVFNYLASMRFVFSHREDLSRTREFVIFVILSLIGLGMNEAIMSLGEELFVLAGIDYGSGPFYVLVKCFATGIVMCWNFLSRRKWLDGRAQSQ